VPTCVPQLGKRRAKRSRKVPDGPSQKRSPTSAATKAKSHSRCGGRASRAKGDRAERAVVHLFQDRGFAAERVPLSGSAGGSYKGDLTVSIAGRDLVAEVKVRANGFAQPYAWLEGRDLLIVKSDRREPLVILPLRLAAEIAAVVERAKAIPDTNLAAIRDASRARPVLARVQTSRTETQYKETMPCLR
jgi:hypothetical protein